MKEIEKYTLKNPFLAPVKKINPLNKQGSSKANNHVEISIYGSDISYEVGCSFGLLPENNKSDVDRILDILGASKELIVTPKKTGQRISIYDFFFNYFNL